MSRRPSLTHEYDVPFLSINAAQMIGSASTLIVTVMHNDAGASPTALKYCELETPIQINRIIFLGISGKIFQRIYIIYQALGESYGQILTYRL